MKGIRMSISRQSMGGVTTVAVPSESDTPFEAIKEEAWQAISTDLEIKISGVSMFAAAWEDPSHWISDWADKLGVDHDDVPEEIGRLFAEAQEEI